MAAVRRALVSGAAGFVGRHFTRRLLADGWEVCGFDTRAFSAASERGKPGRSVAWQADARDLFRIERATYDLVIHCAAVVGGRAKIEGDPLAIAQNLGIDAEMFRWALRTRPTKVVYFSSSAAYPVWRQHADRPRRGLREQDIHLDEELLGTPDAMYGWAKLTGELLAEHARVAGLDVLVVRPFDSA